ncbi:MAG: hypothetical protein AAF412_13325, partial [Pseudomonadota bacterium]
MAGATFDWTVDGISQGSDSLFTYNTVGTTVEVAVEVTSSAGCIVQDTVQVEIGNSVVIGVDFGDSTICYG